MFVDAFRGELPDLAFEELTSEVVGVGVDFAAVVTAIVSPSTVTSERIGFGRVFDFAVGRMDTLTPSIVTFAELKEVVVAEASLVLLLGLKISSESVSLGAFVFPGVFVSLGLPVSLGGSTVTIGSSLWPSRGACAAVSFVSIPLQRWNPLTKPPGLFRHQTNLLLLPRCQFVEIGGLVVNVAASVGHPCFTQADSTVEHSLV